MVAFQVTILILIDGFLQLSMAIAIQIAIEVTILILIDGFLQWEYMGVRIKYEKSHNPYFNRWFSAIKELNNIRKGYYCHNPYFNRWFSAMYLLLLGLHNAHSHNPYFNRWFSAIRNNHKGR